MLRHLRARHCAEVDGIRRGRLDVRGLLRGVQRNGVLAAVSTSAAVYASFSTIPMFKQSSWRAPGSAASSRIRRPSICPGSCEARFPEGTAVTLSATPDPLSRFARFDGSCGGAGCSLTLSADAAIVARFEPRRYQVVDLGLPSGGSWSAPAGISRKGTLVAGTWGGAQG